MKHRKKPVALISALVIVVGGMTMAAINSLPKGEDEHGNLPPSVRAEITQKRTTPTKEQLSDLVKGPKSKIPMDPTEGNVNLSPVPTILLPENDASMPQPMDSSITTQWYSENSRMKEKPKKGN